MVKKDKNYKIVEAITISCFSIGLILTCVTKFALFILVTLIAYPISRIVLENKQGRA